MRYLKLFRGVGLGLALFGFVALLSSCKKTDDLHLPENQIVAEVNRVKITGKEFLKEYAAYKRRLKVGEIQNEELEKKLRKKILDKMVDLKLLQEEAEKNGIKTGDDSQKEMVEGLLEGTSPARLQLVLEKNETSFKDWKDDLKRNMTLESLVRAKLAPYIDVPEEEITAYFKEHPEEFNIKERVHGYHIVVPSLSEADRIRNEIIFGEDFGEMARKYSVSPDAKNNGDLGVFPKGEMPLEFDNVLFKLKINEISKVVESPYGFHIFKVTAVFQPRKMKFSEAREIILNKIFNERLESRFKEWMEQIRKEAEVKIYLEALYRL